MLKFVNKKVALGVIELDENMEEDVAILLNPIFGGQDLRLGVLLLLLLDVDFE